MYHFLGIDPGKQGGLVVIDELRRIKHTAVMPTLGTDICPYKLYELINMIRYDTPNLKVWIERVGARPGSGAAAMFTFGKGFGYLQMAMVALKMPYQFVTPTNWTRDMHKGLGRQFRDTKSRSLASARRLWPDENWRATPRSSTPHDGLYEAALIAEYGRRKDAPPAVNPEPSNF